MKNSIIILITVVFLLAGGFNSFSQTTKKSSKKLVKCYESGKVIYRTKCKTKKSQSVTKKSKPEEKYGDPDDGIGTESGTGRGQGTGSGRGVGTGSGIGNGSGSGAGNGSSSVEDVPPPKPVYSEGTTGLKIISKPRVEYTDVARNNQVQGTVTLRVTFLANGTIGAVSPVSGLPDGLTEQAVSAAKLIRFIPATKDGKPITVVKQVQYTFTLF